MLGSRKLLIVLLSCIVIGSVFVVGLSAEDLVREDPLLTPEAHSALRSASNPEYILSNNGAVLFGHWLASEGYTSDSNLFIPLDTTYRYVVESPSGTEVVSGFYYSDGHLYGIVGHPAQFDSSRLVAFDSVQMYDFFVNEVGVSESDFIYRDAPSSIFAFAISVFSSILGVGSQLLSFVIARPIVLIPIVAMVFVLGYGVIRRLVKGA